MPKLESAHLTSKELSKESEITPDDKLRAAEHWRRVAKQKFKDILDADATE